MSKRNIIRAWKDVEFRNKLSPEEKAQLPENPAGNIEMNDDILKAVSGSGPTPTGVCCPPTVTCNTWGCNCVTLFPVLCE